MKLEAPYLNGKLASERGGLGERTKAENHMGCSTRIGGVAIWGLAA